MGRARLLRGVFKAGTSGNLAEQAVGAEIKEDVGTAILEDAA